ncbi:protein kinase [Anaeramoeba flamelloides]|uniref:Protein kinase n=1 Tax=Anaeramoeba flamelloides TaxID=1746091 RepID=A0ABQ8YVZ2_9EUKA|nr:protein kinase [Anaeramoeba flamelloides]
MHFKTKQQVAIKIVSKKQLLSKPANMERMRREISIQKLIKHPSVLKIYDVYETERNLFLVLEYISGGELFDYIVECGKVPSTQARIFFQQIIFAIEHIHSFSITHRDLKPENLLLDSNYNIKIIDFGMAKIMDTGNLLETACGSPHYVSPDVLKGKGYDGKKSDIWACGVILYALLCGYLPFNNKNYHKLLNSVKKGRFKFPIGLLGENAKDLIRKMLTVRPEKRITIKEIKQHPWFTANYPTPYIPPSPPIDYGKDLEKPILENNIKLNIFEELEQLGWMNPNEIVSELKSKKPNTVKVFYKFFEKYNSQNQNFNNNNNGGNNDNFKQEKENEKKTSKQKRRSLPIKKRRNSLNRIIVKPIQSPNQNTLNSSPDNLSGSSPIEKKRILQLQELIEKTEKNKDLEISQYSDIISKVNSFNTNDNNTKKKNEKNETDISGKEDNNKIQTLTRRRKKRSVSCLSKPIAKNSWGNKLGSNNKDIKSKEKDNDQKELDTNDIHQNNRINTLGKGKFKRNKPRGKSLGSTKSVTPKKSPKRNMKSIFSLGFIGRKKKNKKKKEKKGNKKANNKGNNIENENENEKENEINKNKKNENNNSEVIQNERTKENQQNDLKNKIDPEKKSLNDKEEIKNENKENEDDDDASDDFDINDIDVYINVDNNEQSIENEKLRTPRFHRKKKFNNNNDNNNNNNNNNDNDNDDENFPDLSSTIFQEEMDIGSKRWIDNFVSKKEQKKLNNKLKKKLKTAKKDLMKNLQQNQNLPIFICNNSIIAVTSGDLFSVISELQTALSILNYSWSYPNYITLKGQNGKFIIKIKITKSDLTSTVDVISKKMSDHNNLKISQKTKKKGKNKNKNKKFNNEKQNRETIKSTIWEQLFDLQNTQNRYWKYTIEFIWKTGSSKNFIEETENIIHFLSE